jgi:DNA-binding GntR family transcriptional regulator
MAPEPLVAERTYHRLKLDIVTGKHRLGASFHLQRLADEFGTSITPVRDAIHRMVGERLLEVLPGGGFQLPVHTAQELRELYSWHEQLIRQALHGNLTADALASVSADLLGEEDGQDISRLTSAFFAEAAAASGNREVILAVANASDRLSLARLREPLFLKAMDSELGNLIALARRGQGAAVRVAVREYHRRRLRRVERIALAMRD